jgi:hypothetical protein
MAELVRTNDPGVISVVAGGVKGAGIADRVAEG